jgi:hypothetical protein
MFKFPVPYTISVIPKLRWKHTGMVVCAPSPVWRLRSPEHAAAQFGAELVVDGHAGDIRLTSDRIDGEAEEAIARHE